MRSPWISEEQVTHLYLDQLDQRTQVIQGVVEHIDLEKKLSIKLQVDEQEVTSCTSSSGDGNQGCRNSNCPTYRQFGSKSVGQRSLAIVMGPVMNFILAHCAILHFDYNDGCFYECKTGNC